MCLQNDPLIKHKCTHVDSINPLIDLVKAQTLLISKSRPVLTPFPLRFFHMSLRTFLFPSTLSIIT